MMNLNCYESHNTEGGRRVKVGDTIIANENEFGLYEGREYTVLWTMFNEVRVEISRGHEEIFTLEYFDFPIESLS